MYIGLYIQYPLFLSNFNETWILWTDFQKNISIPNFMNSVEWEPCCSMRTGGRTDRRTDRHDESNTAFRNFGNAPKNRYCIHKTRMLSSIPSCYKSVMTFTLNCQRYHLVHLFLDVTHNNISLPATWPIKLFCHCRFFDACFLFHPLCIP
jgi:hypothetical protein